MKILLSHPTANSNVRAIANGLYSNKLLYRFNTSIAVFPGNLWDKMSSIPGLSDFSRRSFDPLLEPVTFQSPGKELGRMISSKLNFNFLSQPEKGFFCIDKVYSALDKNISNYLKTEKKSIDAIYAYEDGALECFRVAKKKGITCIYDLPIAYWETSRKLLLEEAERLPEWAQTLHGGINDSQGKLERKEEELELADVVVGPGAFVMDSLPDWAKEKKQIISPFGSPKVNPEALKNNIGYDKSPLKVLFVGSMGQRKGLGDLFQAIKILKNTPVELTVLGSLEAPLDFYQKQLANFNYKTGRSHAKVLELMRTCDVLCLPSIVEGRALVMQEAMSQGLPLIITRNTGGEDLIIEGETGFLVPIRSPEAIAEKLEWFVTNKNKIPLMSKRAMEVSQTYTWEDYSSRVVNGIYSFLNEQKEINKSVEGVN